jgi:hypothetical protein
VIVGVYVREEACVKGVSVMVQVVVLSNTHTWDCPKLDH